MLSETLGWSFIRNLKLNFAKLLKTFRFLILKK